VNFVSFYLIYFLLL